METKAEDHDFPDKEMGIPFGICGAGRSKGFVMIGADHGAAAFAADCVRRWHSEIGEEAYPNMKRLMIMADGGGSNGTRVRKWKAELSGLAV